MLKAERRDAKRASLRAKQPKHGYKSLLVVRQVIMKKGAK